MGSRLTSESQPEGFSGLIQALPPARPCLHSIRGLGSELHRTAFLHCSTLRLACPAKNGNSARASGMLLLCLSWDKAAVQRGRPAGRNTTFRGWEEKLITSVISVCGLGTWEFFFAYLLDAVLLFWDYIIFLLSRHSELC